MIPIQLAPLQEAIPDSTALQEAADSLSAVDELSRQFGEAGRELASGEFDAVAALYRSTIERLAGAVPNVIAGIFVFIVLYVLYRVFGYFLKRLLERARRVDEALEKLLVKTYRIVGLTLIMIMVISQFGINITALIAGLSVIGIAVGFAAQDTVSNFISGIAILMDSPFRVGHFVEIEDKKGTVVEITLRSTRVRTLNNQIMVLPNSHMINQKLINHTLLGLVRIEIPFGIAYKEYPQEARKVVLAAASEDPRLHPDFPPTVVVDELSDSSINMVMRLYVSDPSQELELRFEYVEKVREALREAGIEIPFPHLQLHIDSAKGLKDAE